MIDAIDYKAAMGALVDAMDAVKHHPDFTAKMTVELTVAGLADGVMKCSRASFTHGDDTHSITPMGPGTHCLPDLGRPLPASITDEQLVKVAQLVERMKRERGWNLCIGGELDFTVITPDGVAIDRLDAFPSIDARGVA